MAKGQYLTAYQQGIVKRFYEHRDTVLSQRLAELVSEIYLAESEKQRAKLWKSALETLRKAGVPEADAASLCEARSVTDLAAVVSGLTSAGRAPGARPRSQARSGDDFGD